jgi:ATP-dependent helicase/nuclease subunit B
MAKAFGKLTHDGALLLPQLRAIGDLDEGEPPFDLEALGLDLAPAISHVKRRFELAKLVFAHYRPRGERTLHLNAALEFADTLAGFFDSLALEEIDAEARLERLLDNDDADGYIMGAWAEHWQVSAAFLNIAVKAWPQRLNALGLMDPSQRQVALIRRLVDQWADHPPPNPTIIAGSTGSAPSMADLMKVVADAPLGAVVLPGLDLSLADTAWQMIEESHPPQYCPRGNKAVAPITSG